MYTIHFAPYSQCIHLGLSNENSTIRSLSRTSPCGTLHSWHVVTLAYKSSSLNSEALARMEFRRCVFFRFSFISLPPLSLFRGWPWTFRDLSPRRPKADIQIGDFPIFNVINPSVDKDISALQTAVTRP